MKRIILILSLATLIACSKEKRCNCGVVANDGITNGCYWLEIRNDCTNNKKKFCYDRDVWMSHYVGDPICVPNETW